MSNRKINYSDYKDIPKYSDYQIKKQKSKLFCCICFEELQNAEINLSITKCNHHFCTTCLIKTMKHSSKCPLCRTILRSPKKPISINYFMISSLIQEELFYHSTYVNDLSKYIIDVMKYAEKKIETANEENEDYIKEIISKELVKLLKNFGIGISVSINKLLYEHTSENIDLDNPNTNQHILNQELILEENLQQNLENIEENLQENIEETLQQHIEQNNNITERPPAREGRHNTTPLSYINSSETSSSLPIPININNSNESLSPPFQFNSVPNNTSYMNTNINNLSNSVPNNLLNINQNTNNVSNNSSLFNSNLEDSQLVSTENNETPINLPPI